MREHIKTGTLLALLIAVLVLLVFSILKLGTLLILVLIAIVITTGIDPIVCFVQRLFARWWRMPRSLATIFVLLAGILVFLGIISFLTATAISEAMRFANNVWPHLQKSLLAKFQTLSHHYPFIPKLPNVLSALQGQSDKVAEYVWSTTIAVFALLGGFFSVVTVVILTMFFTIYKDGIVYTLLQLVPPPYQAQVREIGHEAAQKMGGWLRGQLTLAFIITVSISLMMIVLGIPYPVLIGLIGGLGELIPMVGPYLAFFPAIAIALSTHASPGAVIGVIVFFLVISQLENYVLAPRIMQKRVGLHPVTTVLAILTGGTLLGIVGALLAIPLTAAGRVIMLEAVFPAIQGKTRQQIESNQPDAPAPKPATPKRKRRVNT